MTKFIELNYTENNENLKISVNIDHIIHFEPDKQDTFVKFSNGKGLTFNINYITFKDKINQILEQK